jgi:hypothetical protein
MNNKSNNQNIPSLNKIKNYRNNSPGKVVQRYNISLAKVEYYFIPTERFEAYDIAITRQDYGAYKKYGTKMKSE